MEEVSIDQAMQLAVTHHRAGRLPQAERVCRLILSKQPGHGDALNLLAVLAYHAGQNDLALQLVHQAIAVNPLSADYHSNLGNLLRADNQNIAAIDAYRKAIALNPDLAEAHNNLGSAFTIQGQLDHAITCHQISIRLNPNLPETHSNLGNALSEIGQLDRAIEAYHAALLLKPDYAEVHLNLGMCLLLKGDYAAGWREYEWRLKSEPDYAHLLWDGGDLHGRTILLRAEQGFGDTIQFIRYLPLVADRGGQIIVECQPELIGLLKHFPFVTEWISVGQPLPRFDVWRSLLSLPFVFGTILSDIPQQDPLLKPASDRKEDFRKRLAEFPAGLKIGLAWAGRSEHKNDRNRSIPFSLLSTLADVPNAEFVSLQKGSAGDQARTISNRLQLIDLTDGLDDFADTAALIANLDLVICVDTAIAHLAGAMGKPVWLLLPFAPDWRWGIERMDSPWYPTMRLFRQPRIGDWSEVIGRVAKELCRFNPSDAGL